MKIGKTSFRRWFVLISVCVCSFLVIGCGRREADTTETIIKSGVLKVAMIDGRSNLLTKHDSDYSGMEADLVKQVSEKLGLSIQYIPVNDASDGMKHLQEGNVDLVIGSVTKSNVPNELAVSKAYAESSLYVVTRRNVFCNSIYGLAEKIVGLSENATDYRMDSFSFMTSDKMKVLNDTDEVVEALKTEMIAGYYCYPQEAEKLLEASDLVQAQNVLDAIEEEYIVVTLPANQGLLNSVNEVIDNGTF